jgi:tRNA-specific 2-thiouridylase
VSGTHDPRFAVEVVVPERRVVIGSKRDLLTEGTTVADPGWAHEPFQGEVWVQTSAHGTPAAASLSAVEEDRLVVSWHEPHQRVAPGQSVVFYEDDRVVGGGTASANS